jgi:hypothetical protein
MNNSDNTCEKDDMSAYGHDLPDVEIKEMLQRKEDYLFGKVKATSWNEIKKRYSKSEIENPKSEID